ncbi:MAG: metallophosphoesterase family protein [Bacteroidota bacterium]
MRKFAISDIHGCSQTFRKLVEEVLKLTHNDELYLLGDYVDRGPDSKGVLDFIMELREKEYTVNCLMGNHEQMMLNAWRDEEDVDLWLLNGGKTTLDSFGVTDVEDIPEKYIKLLRSFKFYFEVDKYILVHAGLNFHPTIPTQDSDFIWKVIQPFKDVKSMLWIRDWYNDMDYDWLRGRVIVHGHTPVSDEVIRSMVADWTHIPAIDIDNGCFISFQEGMGHLCSFELTFRKLFFQKNVEHQESPSF